MEQSCLSCSKVEGEGKRETKEERIGDWAPIIPFNDMLPLM